MFPSLLRNSFNLLGMVQFYTHKNLTTSLVIWGCFTKYLQFSVTCGSVITICMPECCVQQPGYLVRVQLPELRRTLYQEMFGQ